MPRSEVNRRPVELLIRVFAYDHLAKPLLDSSVLLITCNRGVFIPATCNTYLDSLLSLSLRLSPGIHRIHSFLAAAR